MQFSVNEIDYRHLRPLLERNGFGIVELPNPYHESEVLGVRLWANVDEAGIPGGGEVGAVTRDLGHIARWTLTLNDFHLSRERIHGLLTDVLNQFVRGEK